MSQNLYVGNLSYDTTADDLRTAFAAHGVVLSAQVVMDRETGSRWTLAGRAVDGPLKGKELTWINSVQCRWYAWAAEYPGTTVAR